VVIGLGHDVFLSGMKKPATVGPGGLASWMGVLEQLASVAEIQRDWIAEGVGPRDRFGHGKSGPLFIIALAFHWLGLVRRRACIVAPCGLDHGHDVLPSEGPLALVDDVVDQSITSRMQ